MTATRAAAAALLTATALALTSCGSSDDKPAAATPTAIVFDGRTYTKDMPWIDIMMPKYEREVTRDGHKIRVDDKKRTIATESCEITRKITKEGQEFGPKPRTVDPSGTPGYQAICKS